MPKSGEKLPLVNDLGSRSKALVEQYGAVYRHELEKLEVARHQVDRTSVGYEQVIHGLIGRTLDVNGFYAWREAAHGSLIDGSYATPHPYKGSVLVQQAWLTQRVPTEYARDILIEGLNASGESVGLWLTGEHPVCEWTVRDRAEPTE